MIILPQKQPAGIMIPEETRSRLFDAAAAAFRRAAYADDPDPVVNRWGRQGVQKYEAFCWIMRELGIYAEFVQTAKRYK